MDLVLFELQRRKSNSLKADHVPKGRLGAPLLIMNLQSKYPMKLVVRAQVHLSPPRMMVAQATHLAYWCGFNVFLM